MRSSLIADVLLLPSELESFGLAALEAMASECRSHRYRVGGLPEVIDHGTTGFLAEVGDVDDNGELRNRASRTMNRAARNGKSMPQGGRRPLFVRTSIIPQYEEFYRRVLERSS